MQNLWIDKYRPRHIVDIITDSTTMDKIKQIVKDRDMPNLIITGTPGTGKTSTLTCIARELLGKYMKEYMLELNVSNERGIKLLQDSLKFFCEKKFELNETEKDKYSKHKIIIIDEADGMTKKEIHFINGLIDKYAKTTRFAFTCNNSHDIAENIQSKCIILRYSRMNMEQIAQKLVNICELENVTYDASGIDSLIKIVNGDLRQAINNLQITHLAYGHITEDAVYKLNDIPYPKIIENLFTKCLNKQFIFALQILDELKEKGYSTYDISLNMFNVLREMKNIDEKSRMRYMEEVAKLCIVISKGMSNYLQLTGCIASLCK